MLFAFNFAISVEVTTKFEPLSGSVVAVAFRLRGLPNSNLKSSTVSDIVVTLPSALCILGAKYAYVILAISKSNIPIIKILSMYNA